MTMNPEAQAIFNKILIKLDSGAPLMAHDISFLKARRSYLSSWQRLKYGDILYLNKQFFFQKLRNVGVFLGKFAHKIVVGIIVAIVVGLILGYLGSI